MASVKTPEDKARELKKRKAQLASIRSYYEPMWDNIIRYVTHYMRPIDATESDRGTRTGTYAYDGTPLSALNLLADGLHGFLVSQSIRWFSLTLPNIINFHPTSTGAMRRWNGKRADEMPDVKAWLQMVEEVIYAAFLRSNFYEVTPEFFRAGGSIGTVSMYREHDVGSGRTVYHIPHTREVYIAENKYGEVDTVYRVYPFTLRQLVSKFGYESASSVDPNFKFRYENNPYEEVDVLHAVFPRDDFDPRKADVKNKPFASMWMKDGGDKLLLESGMENKCYNTWRWKKNSGEWYGGSPSWDSFVEIMKSNQMEKDILEVSHGVAKPPYIMTEDMRGRVRIMPSGRTYVTQSQYDRPPIPLATNYSQFPISIDRQNRAQAIIKEHFHVDFFLMLSEAAQNRVPLTATQVIEMSGEKAAILGTRIGRLQSEFLNPEIDWTFENEVSNGRIPKPPQILLDMAGANIEVDYLGPLAQAQKRLFKTQGIFAGLEAATKVAVLVPESMDIIDGDITMREVLDATGFPAKALRDEDTVKMIRGQRAQVQQGQMELESMEKVANMLPKAAKGAEPGSPMEQLMGGGKKEDDWTTADRVW